MAFRKTSKNKYIYEQGSDYKNENEAGLAYARILSVSPDKRNCEIITWGAGLSDKYFQEAQILSLDTNRYGDEFISIPRRGSIGIVIILGNQAYILGFVRPNSVSGAPIWGNEIQLRQGDKLITTKAGNRISVRSNGLVEAVSVHGGLQTIWSPSDKSINEVCTNKRTTLGCGSEKWEYDLDTSLCKHRQLFKKDGAQTAAIIEERGHVAGFSPASIADPLLFKQQMGFLPPGVTDIPLTQFYRDIDILGLRKTYIGPTSFGVTSGIEKLEDGLLANLKYSLGVAKQVDLEADGLLGDVKLDLFKLINLQMTPSSGGGVILKTPLTTIEIEPSGGYSILNGKGTLPGAEVSSIRVSPLGDLAFKNPVLDVKLEKTGDVTIKNPTIEAKLTKTGDTTITNSTKAYEIAAKSSGEISATDRLKGALKISQGKVALGGASAELLAILDEFIDEVTNVVTGLSTETHVGNMGIPTVPDPSQKKTYIEGITKITDIKTKLATIKGSL